MPNTSWSSSNPKPTGKQKTQRFSAKIDKYVARLRSRQDKSMLSKRELTAKNHK